uniref:Protein hunchback n=2 Tax=Cacopsylla melanoneura TaxID=428564 RepID=A0A8D8M5H6_9HEMI
MLVHTEERPYQCELCDYTCKQSGNLKAHMVVHTEERPYQCEICEYTCKQSSSLRKHMLVHTEERPYQCELCEYTCKQSNRKYPTFGEAIQQVNILGHILYVTIRYIKQDFE